MTTSEVLDLAARAYQSIGRQILFAVATPSLLCLAGFMFFWSFAVPSLFATKDPNSTATQFSEAATALGLGLFVAAPLFMMGLSYACTLATHMIGDFMVGNVPNLNGAKRSARQKLKSVFGLLMRELVGGCFFFIVAMALLFLSVLLTEGTSDGDFTPVFTSILGSIAVVAGIIWAPLTLIRDGLAPAAMIMENLGTAAAVKRSRALLKSEGPHPGGYDPLVNAFALIAILYLVGAWGLMALASELGIGTFLADQVVGSSWADLLEATFAFVPWFLVIWVTIPLWATVSTILYFERRVRKEGYDIEVLAQEVWRADQSRRFQL